MNENNTPSLNSDFRQYVEVPFIGSSYVSREDGPLFGRSFLFLAIHHKGDTYSDDHEVIRGDGPMYGYTLTIGRWRACLDRPTLWQSGLMSDPMIGNKTLWLAVFMPALLFLGFTGAVLGGTFKRCIARPMGWMSRPRYFQPEA